jgi:hypothetical protein
MFLAWNSQMLPRSKLIECVAKVITARGHSCSNVSTLVQDSWHLDCGLFFGSGSVLPFAKCIHLWNQRSTHGILFQWQLQGFPWSDYTEKLHGPIAADPSR